VNTFTNAQYKLGYQQHLMELISGKTSSPIPISYFGIGVGGSLREDDVYNRYSIKTANRTSTEMFTPIPVLIINTSTEDNSGLIDTEILESVGNEYTGYDTAIIAGSRYLMFWYKKLEVLDPVMVSIDELAREIIDNLDTAEHPTVASLFQVTASLYGKDVIPSLMTYVKHLTTMDANAILDMSINEIGYFANTATSKATTVDICKDSHLLVRHDCMSGLTIPNLSTTLSIKQEFVMGDYTVLKK